MRQARCQALSMANPRAISFFFIFMIVMSLNVLLTPLLLHRYCLPTFCSFSSITTSLSTSDGVFYQFRDQGENKKTSSFCLCLPRLFVLLLVSCEEEETIYFFSRFLFQMIKAGISFLFVDLNLDL